jgi:nucleotide-binding universal stress UspA family protein
MEAPKIILVPSDFSAAAESALDHALALASELDSTVYVLHTYDLPIIGLPDGSLLPYPEVAARIVNDAQKGLADCVAKRKDSGVRVVPLLKQGDPRETILATAQDLTADLIVMGTHGRRGIVRALIGSVAEAVVRVSPVPVLTVHAAA